MSQDKIDAPDCIASSEKYTRLITAVYEYADGGDSVVECNGNIIQQNIAIEEIDIISKQICKNWILIQTSLYDDLNIPIESLKTARNHIDNLFNIVVGSLISCRGTTFSTKYIKDAMLGMRKCSALILPMSDMDTNTSTRLALATMKNPNCPVYIYFHTFLDIQYYLLMLSNLCGKSLDDIETQLKEIMKALTWYIKMLYVHLGPNTRVFSCSCSKHFWISLQSFTEHTYASSEVFWKLFNTVVSPEDPVFILWLLRDVALLYLIKSENNTDPPINFDLLENSLKNIISNSNTKSLEASLIYMQPLLTDAWLKSSRIEVYQIMWDHFSKRMNRRFVELSLYCSSAVVFSDLIDTVLWCPKDCKGDFLIFMSFLITHLKAHPHHWSKIKGRIYSQLNPHKIRDFDKCGIFNVLLLYNCLLVINPAELTKKIISVVEALPDDKKLTEIVWNIQISFMLREVKDGHHISISQVMVQMLQNVTEDNTKFWLVRTFISGFENIIDNSKSMQLNQWSLLNTWLSKYLLTCNYSDLNSTLVVLINIINRVKGENVWSDWECVFKEVIHPALKQIANTPTSPGTIGTLSAKISLLSPSLSVELFSFFNSENMSANISSEYLCELLEDYPGNCILSPDQESMALQTWIKTSILTVGSYEKLTSNIVKLDSFLQTVKDVVLNSNDPFVSFLEHLGSNIKEYSKSHAILRLCETCFGQTDRWISQYFIQPDNEQIVTRLYVSMAVLFTHCAPLLYDRNKATCPLARLITCLLLPTEFMVGKSLHPFILNGVKSTWYHFVISIVKLNSVSDFYLERTLRDLVVKYLPYFSSCDSPIIKCLDDSESACVVLDKISNAFFKYPTKEPDANVLKALKLLGEYVVSTTSPDAYRLVVKKCLHNIFEVIMFHNQRNTAMSLLKNITAAPLYVHTKQDAKEAIITVTEKHMAFHTVPYFQLMNVLAKFIPRDLQSTMPRVHKHLCTVERMRGVGNDKVLRLHFEKLQNMLQQSQQK